MLCVTAEHSRFEGRRGLGGNSPLLEKNALKTDRPPQTILLLKRTVSFPPVWGGRS